jgi:hypothetical protein
LAAINSAMVTPNMFRDLAQRIARLHRVELRHVVVVVTSRVVRGGGGDDGRQRAADDASSPHAPATIGSSDEEPRQQPEPCPFHGAILGRFGAICHGA